MEGFCWSAGAGAHVPVGTGHALHVLEVLLLAGRMRHVVRGPRRQGLGDEVAISQIVAPMLGGLLFEHVPALDVARATNFEEWNLLPVSQAKDVPLLAGGMLDAVLDDDRVLLRPSVPRQNARRILEVRCRKNFIAQRVGTRVGERVDERLHRLKRLLPTQSIAEVVDNLAPLPLAALCGEFLALLLSQLQRLRHCDGHFVGLRHLLLVGTARICALEKYQNFLFLSTGV